MAVKHFISFKCDFGKDVVVLVPEVSFNGTELGVRATEYFWFIAQIETALYFLRGLMALFRFRRSCVR